MSSQPLMRHHPRIGYGYIPGLKTRVTANGTGYLLRTNSMGFRSDHEFSVEKTPGKRRVLMFGDSQTAGDWVSNGKRFSDLLEKKVDDLEVYNMALTGSGTDQQFLIYQENGAALEHDLVVVCIFVENVMRVQRKLYVRPNPEGEIRYYGKPYFDWDGDALTLQGVPVPEKPWTSETLPARYRGGELELDLPGPRRTSPGEKVARKFLPEQMLRLVVPLVRHVVRNDAVPPYGSPTNQKWLLMRRILEDWIAMSRMPLMIVPLPLSHDFIGSNRPCKYQARFPELVEATGCRYFDPLPGIRKLSEKERQETWNYKNGHLTEFGHQVLAELLAPSIAAALPSNIERRTVDFERPLTGLP